MTKFILPAKLRNMVFVYNGEMGEPRYFDPRPKGKVHIKRYTRWNRTMTRCGIGAHEDWDWWVHIEDICRTCLKYAFMFYPKEIEL